MAKIKIKKQIRKRMAVQAGAALLGNAYLPGFVRGTIYQGQLKKLCLPGLNCYSCPGALGACPVGALQNSIADPHLRISFYVLGFLMLIGSLLGRFVCGWLCPFGLIQDALHKIRSQKWRPEKRLVLHRNLLWAKYMFLAVFVLIWPFIGRVLYGYGDPTFCKYICPSGTIMAGWPLVAVNEALRQLAGFLFGWKSLLLVMILLLAVTLYRPFCRYICPLGAIYGFFNRISLYRIRVDQKKCTQCGACTRQCPMAVSVPADGNTPECIRCGECEAVCPYDAIKCGFPAKEKTEEKSLA